MKKRQELSCASRERKKSCEEKEELSQSHLITSSGELKAEIFAVDELPESTSRKKNGAFTNTNPDKKEGLRPNCTYSIYFS